MPKSKQKKLFSVDKSKILNFKAAYYSIGKQNLVIFYYKNLKTGKFQRFRITIPKQKSIKLTRKMGEKMVNEINQKLFSGWNPFTDETKPQIIHQDFDTASKLFIEKGEKNVKLDLLRPDTLRSYKSFVSIVNMYLKKKKIKTLILSDITKSFVMNELDWMLYDRKNKPRTRNNHLGYWVTFLNFCMDKGFLEYNVASGIKKLREKQKVRQVFTPRIKEKVKLLNKENPAFYTLCMMTYYCFVRRTEITKLKVSDLTLPYYITIGEHVSKNRKENNVTIPHQLNKLLLKHIDKASLNDYLFSDNDFKPGKKQLAPKKISDEWNKFRKRHEIPNVYQFYSLKDTGITDLLRKGVPAIKVRDQARHYDLTITERYTARIKTYDEEIKNIDFTF